MGDTIKGYPSISSEDRTGQSLVTINKLNQFEVGMSGYSLELKAVTTLTIDSGTTTEISTTTDHNAREGDIMIFQTGTAANIDVECVVQEVVSPTVFSIAQSLITAPSATDTFILYRPVRHLQSSASSGTATVEEQEAQTLILTDIELNFATLATEATLSALNTKIPSSPATVDKQNTGNSSLSSIDGKITACNTGAVIISNSSGASAVNVQDGGNSITIDGTVTASNATGNVAHDSADSGSPVKIGMKAVSWIPTAVTALDRVDSIGDLFGNSNIKGAFIPTFSAVSGTFTPAATATDVWNITGSASKTIRILRIILSGTQTTAGNIATISLIKRSAVDTGGTSVANTAVPLDSGFPAATASVQHYTANPAGLGASVGRIYSPRVLVPAPATAVQPPIIFDFNTMDWINGTPVILRGTAEQLNINLGGGALPTGAANFSVTCIWTEE